MKAKVFEVVLHRLPSGSALTDIQLKSSSGLDFIKAIRAHAPERPVVAPRSLICVKATALRATATEGCLVPWRNKEAQ